MDDVLSSVGPKFDKKLMTRHVLDKLPVFMRKAIYLTPDFSQKCTTYNKLLLMAATNVCNYYDTPGFTNWGPGNASVMLNGLIHHFMRIASSNNTQSCGLSYFIFDNSASHVLIKKYKMM